MAKLEFTNLNTILFSKEDVFFVTIKKNIAQTDDGDPILVWFENNSTSKPEYWNIERDYDCSDYTSRTNSFSLFSPKTQTDTISLAISLKQDVDIPPSTSLTIKCELSSVNETDKATTTLYYQSAYNPFSVSSSIYESNSNYNIPDDSDGTKQLLRTNPKLSGNIKITIDSNNNVWLNTIDANIELSANRFKKYKVSSNNSYAYDLRKFLDDGRLETKSLFFIDGQDNSSSKTEYSEQYKTQYWSGSEYLPSLFYNEEFSIFSPLWIDKTVPDYFVIFSSESVVNDSQKDFTYNFKENIIKNSKILKVFSLKEGTTIGNYIRGIINSNSYKSSPINVIFDKDFPTITYRGIDFKNGVYTEKNVIADDLITEDNPIAFFEKRIIDGFEKNDLVCYNLLNLEFLFDDNQAYEYDINRYFGFYVNENELSKFVIDEESMSNLYSWIPENKFKIDNNSEIEIFDNQGISIIADLNSPEQPKIPSSQLISDLEHIFYVKGKYNLYKIDDTEILQTGSNGFKMKSVGKIKTSQKKFDLSDITGFSSTKIIAKSELKDNAGFPFYIQNTDKYRDADSISLIYQKGGMQKEWKVVANSYAVPKGSTLEQEFISNPIDINVCANINTITSYDNYNIGKIFIPELLDFSIGSNVLLDYGYKILNATIQSIQTTTLSSGNDTFVVASTSNLKVNQPIIGTGILPNTYITDIDTGTNTITISQNATISGSSSITFCASVLIQGAYANNISDGDILTAKDLINLTSYQLSVSEDSFLISGNTAVPLQTAQIITTIESNPSNYLVRFSGLKIASASDYTTKEAYLIINTNIFNVLSTTGLSVNQPVSGDGIPSGAYITAINTLTNAITISKNATKTGLSNLTFSSSIKLEGNLTSIISSGDNLTIKNLTTDVTYQVFVNVSPIAISNYTIVPLENASIIDDVISNLTNFSVRLLVDNPSIFKSKTCEIIDVEKDTDSYFTYLHLKDSTKSVLNTLNKSSDIFVHIYYYSQSIYNYFNPIGSESEYLSSIVKAFNTFDNKKFTASYVNNAIVLRSEFEEDAYFKIKIDLLGNSTELSSILIHNVESLGLEIGKDSSNNPIYKKIITAEYNNPKQRKVFTIPKEYSNNITGDEWVKTINSNKKLKPYQIQNSTTYYLYTEDENKLELELLESFFPELDKESNVVFFNLHRNSLGVMSFLPIVDFDFDFLDSDYSYLPSEELKKYFKAYYSGDSLPINEIYRVFCEQGVVISLYAVKTNGDRIKVQPTNTVESGKVRTISLDTSTNLISMHTIPALYSETIGNTEISHFVFESTNPINRANKTYFQNVTSWSTKNISGRNESETGEFGIIQFEGFNTITDFIEATELQEINRLRELNSVDRFSNFILASEYEVLRENYNKNLFNLGRVIPYINKWVAQHSSDVRSNEYRLNTSLAFGDKGFSPDNLIKDPNPIVFTHEWYYIEGMPSWYSDSAAKKDKNYTFSSISDSDLYSTEYDGFVRSFIRGSHKELYEGNVLNTETKKLYTYVKFDKQLNKAIVFFKGAKFQLNVSTPSIYDNWKFTAVLRPRRRSPFSKGGDISYKLVENKKWKTLTFIIDAYLPNYNFPERELNLLGLYTSESSKQISISSGSYDKFVFTNSDIQLSGGLVPTFDSVTLSGNYISVKATSDLTNEINRVGNQNYSDIRVFGYGKRQEDINIGNIYLQFYGRNINEISSNNITFNYNPNDNLPGSDPTDGLAIGYEFLANTKRPFYPPIHINYLLETPSSFLNSSSYYIKGGYNYLKSLIRDISFASIKEIMESNNYSHIIVSENGDVTTEDRSTTFGFTYVMPSTINKKGLLQVSPDKDVPNQFSLENVIGYNLSVTDYDFQVVRYGGDFIPKTKEIVNFTAAESLKFIGEFGTGNKKNTRFFFDHNSFGILKNQALHKVSEKKILSLSDSEKYKPVYPLLNESGIDYKDISIISTNWDYDFYRNYSSKVNFSSLSPLIEPKEIKSFLGSKLANTPMTLLIESFEYANSLDTSKDFWYEIKDSIISIHLLPENILLKNLKTDKFRENMINSISKLRNDDLFTEEFFEEYILTNLVKIYKVSSIKLFYKGDRKEQEIFLNTDEQTRNTLSFTEVPGIYVENRIEDILIKKSIGELSNPQLSLSIIFEKI